MNNFDWINCCTVDCILKTFSDNISFFISSNLIQLTSSTLHPKIKVSTGVLGLGNNTFLSICGTFFLFQAHLVTDCESVNMPPHKKAACMIDHIRTGAAIEELRLSRDRIIGPLGPFLVQILQGILRGCNSYCCFSDTVA